MGYQNDLIQKKLISSRFQVLGITASSLSLFITVVLLVLAALFFKALIPIYTFVFFTQSISLLSYIFFWKSIKVATVFIWLGALSILTLTYPWFFFAGNTLFYLPSALLAFAAAIGSLKPDNRWLWTGAITTILAFGFVGIRLPIIRQTSAVEPQETLLYIVTLLQMLGLVGYMFYIRLIGKIFIWLSVLALFSLAVFEIYETFYYGGILVPFHSVLLTIICTKGALRASSNFKQVNQ